MESQMQSNNHKPRDGKSDAALRDY